VICERDTHSFILRLPVTPVGQERARHSRNGHTYTPAKTRQATNEIRELWSLAGKPVVEGEWFSISILAQIPKPRTSKLAYPARPDVDNIAKLVLDALQGYAFQNDSRCCSLSVSKEWGGPLLVARIKWGQPVTTADCPR